MGELNKGYIVLCQYPGKLSFISVGMVLPADHTQEDFVEPCEMSLQQYLPEGFIVKSVYLDWMGYKDGKTVWDSSMKEND